MRRRLILVGGVGQLYQGDLDLGRVAVERLASENLGDDVLVEELSYGAVAVAQRLEDLRPTRLVLVGAEERGREPGTVTCMPAAVHVLTPADVQGAVADAVTGYVGLDLVVAVAHGLGALPADTVVVEVEPGKTEPSETISAEAEAALGSALDLVRREVGRKELETA